MLRPCRQTIQILEKLPQTRTGAFACALTPLAASCTMNWARALSSAVRAFGLHPKGRPFKSDSAHHPCASLFSWLERRLHSESSQTLIILAFRELISDLIAGSSRDLPPMLKLPRATLLKP